MIVPWAACFATLAVVSASPFRQVDKRDGCNQDNCYRALDGFQRTSDAAFCSEFLHTSNKAAPAAITTMELCGPLSISSGCSCLWTSTARVSALVSSQTPTTPSDRCPAPNTATPTAQAPITTTVIITATAQGVHITMTETMTISGSGLDVTYIETHEATITETAPGVTTTVTVPGDSVTITSTPPTVATASTVTAEVNPNGIDYASKSTANAICPLAEKITITTSNNDATGNRPSGTLSLYTVRCDADYDAGSVLFSGAAIGLQECAQQCTDYSSQHDTECTAAIYSLGQCYGRSGTLKDQAVQYSDAVVLSSAIVNSSQSGQ